MNFLAGTIHVLLVYLVIGLVLCVPPYFKTWERLVERLDQVEFNGKRASTIFYVVAPVLLAAAVVITHLFQYHKDLQVNFWSTFAPASFLILPLTAAFFGVTAWERARGRVGLGRLGALLFCYGGFGVAGTNIHDVLWCGRRTRFYTEFFKGGYDLDLWMDLLHPPTADYRTFGFYMGVQVLIGLAAGHVVFFRFLKISGLKRDLAPLGYAYLATAALGFAITLIDWPRVLTPPLMHTSIVAIAVVASCYWFHKSGLALSRIERQSVEENTEAQRHKDTEHGEENFS